MAVAESAATGDVVDVVRGGAPVVVVRAVVGAGPAPLREGDPQDATTTARTTTATLEKGRRCTTPSVWTFFGRDRPVRIRGARPW